MKFNDGYWLLRQGVTATYAKEAFAVETSDSTVSVAALSRPVEHRGSHLNTPTVTVDLSSPAPYTGPGIVEVGAQAKSDPDLGRRVVARPKAPDGVDAETLAKVQLPGPPPLPPKRPARLWLAPFLKKLGRQLRRPLGRWAAMLVTIGF